MTTYTDQQYAAIELWEKAFGTRNTPDKELIALRRHQIQESTRTSMTSQTTKAKRAAYMREYRKREQK